MDRENHNSDETTSQICLNDLIDERATFEPAALKATRELARAKPWRGEWEARFDLLKLYVDRLALTYNVPPIALTHEGPRSGCSGTSYYDPNLNAIILQGRLSVVTVMHLFCAARGMEPMKRIRWSVNLFRRCFPKSFGRCALSADGLLINVNRVDA